MDVQVWDRAASTLTNLTRSPAQFEEQAEFSPDGQRIVFMSTRGQQPAYDPRRFWQTFRTDLWLMNADGSHQVRLTYVGTPGHPEYRPGQFMAIPTAWGPGGNTIYFGVGEIAEGQVNHTSARIFRLTLAE